VFPGPAATRAASSRFCATEAHTGFSSSAATRAAPARESRFRATEAHTEISRFAATDAATTTAFIHVTDFSIHGTVPGRLARSQLYAVHLRGVLPFRCFQVSRYRESYLCLLRLYRRRFLRTVAIPSPFCPSQRREDSAGTPSESPSESRTSRPCREYLKILYDKAATRLDFLYPLRSSLAASY